MLGSMPRVSGFSIVESSQVFVLLLLLVLPLIALAWAPPKTYQADLLHHRRQLHQQLRQQSAQRPWLPRVAPEPGSRTLGSPKGSGASLEVCGENGSLHMV